MRCEVPVRSVEVEDTFSTRGTRYANEYAGKDNATVIAMFEEKVMAVKDGNSFVLYFTWGELRFNLEAPAKDKSDETTL